MSRRSYLEKPTPRMTWLPLAMALLLCASGAVAQTNLGELLDAGATPLAAEEFRQDVVGRMLVGPTATGGKLELRYITDGSVTGAATLQRGQYAETTVSGTWTIDDNGRVCISMRVGAGGAMGNASWGPVVLPARCQRWFKYAGAYFVSDSESDRSGKVLRRTLKP
jgi:hypothetical protein